MTQNHATETLYLYTFGHAIYTVLQYTLVIILVYWSHYCSCVSGHTCHHMLALNVNNVTEGTVPSDITLQRAMQHSSIPLQSVSAEWCALYDVTSLFQLVGKRPSRTPSVQQVWCTPYHGRAGTDNWVPADVRVLAVPGTFIATGSGEDAATTWSTDTSM
jgi:hypothetical protein